ncbi:protein of unknown function [Xenorhabdus poinarii G6]|uniref:Uncharacterized protein n=1 Tax=Xenorhabdus poinarii G6 TaxID=1354304 RepID=A0A068R5Y2_9GAMM|nr:protein of unknown function [Xenorhabdus poinarii G6]
MLSIQIVNPDEPAILAKLNNILSTTALLFIIVMLSYIRLLGR